MLRLSSLGSSSFAFLFAAVSTLHCSPRRWSPRPHCPASRFRRQGGFSLVEVVLALGVCSFAMVAIVGMIPVGLSTFQDAIDTTAQTQILQRVGSEVLLTDFDEINDAVYYYDDQGGRVDSIDSNSLAYTVQLTRQDLSGPMQVDPHSTVTVMIKIARTHPGQTFSDIETRFPRLVFSYPVVVSNTNH